MSLETSLNELVIRLAENKRFPKYQFERSAEIFLSLFVEEYFSLYFRDEVKYVAAEFGIKKDTTKQSTNVDYLLLRKGETPAWLFIEIKTDPRSIKPKSFERYVHAQKIGMIKCMQGLDEIALVPPHQKKYEFLIKRIKGASDNLDLPIIIFCISLQPVPSKITEKYPTITWLEMSDIVKGITDSQHPELWEITKKLISLV